MFSGWMPADSPTRLVALLALRVVVHAGEKRPNRGNGFLAGHQLLLLEDLRHVLDRTLTVYQRHDERIDLRRHRLGTERLRHRYRLLAGDEPVGQGLVPGHLSGIALLVCAKRKHPFLPAVTACR